MQLAFCYLDRPQTSSSSSEYLKANRNRQRHFIQLIENKNISVSVVQRAGFQETYSQDKITYYFTRDEYGSTLRWWQEPMNALEILLQIKPDIIEVAGLSLPLNFRWMRRIIGDKIKIVGRHTGEDIWAQRNLWLQQFGLRVVDGFIFQKKADTEPWIRASVILPRQPLYILNAYGTKEESEIKKLQRIYHEMVKPPG
jgi:hypothetical protein